MRIKDRSSLNIIMLDHDTSHEEDMIDIKFPNERGEVVCCRATQYQIARPGTRTRFFLYRQCRAMSLIHHRLSVACSGWWMACDKNNVRIVTDSIR